MNTHSVRAWFLATLVSATLASAAPAPKPGAAERLAAIVKEMKSPDREVRLKAVGKLVHFEGGQEQALPVLTNLREAMRDPEGDIRAVACTAMGNFHEKAKGVVPDFVRLLRDPDKEVRQCSARALGRVGADAKSALPEMARATKDEDAVVRVVTHAAMIRIGAPVAEHLPAVLKGMEDASPLVRYKSAHCLEPLGAVAAPGVLKLGSLLTDPDEKVRHYSARALARLDEVAGEQGLDGLSDPQAVALAPASVSGAASRQREVTGGHPISGFPRSSTNPRDAAMAVIASASC